MAEEVIVTPEETPEETPAETTNEVVTMLMDIQGQLANMVEKIDKLAPVTEEVPAEETPAEETPAEEPTEEDVSEIDRLLQED